MTRILIIKLLIFFTATSLQARGDSDYAFYLSNIPSNGILLDKGWRFHAGDDKDWAKPGFDDNEWQSIDASKDIYDLPQLRQSGIGWFRLYLQIDSMVLKESLALIIEQTGASEIYLNGNNIYSFGIISRNQKNIKPYDPLSIPVSVQFGKQSLQILAVRYAYKKNMPYFIFAGRPNHCFAITINRANQAIKSVSGSPSYLPDTSRAGLFFILAILHFALYVFYPKKRGNLFFSLFAVAAVITNITYICALNTYNTIPRMYLLWFTIVLFNLYNLLFLKALYVVTQNKRSFIYQVLNVCFLLSIPLYFRPYHLGWIFGFIILPNAILAECVRISFLAVKRKQKGAAILAIGAVNFLIFYVSFYIAYYFVPSKIFN